MTYLYVYNRLYTFMGFRNQQTQLGGTTLYGPTLAVDWCRLVQTWDAATTLHDRIGMK